LRKIGGGWARFQSKGPPRKNMSWVEGGRGGGEKPKAGAVDERLRVGRPRGAGPVAPKKNFPANHPKAFGGCAGCFVSPGGGVWARIGFAGR